MILFSLPAEQTERLEGSRRKGFILVSVDVSGSGFTAAWLGLGLLSRLMLPGTRSALCRMNESLAFSHRHHHQLCVNTFITEMHLKRNLDIIT